MLNNELQVMIQTNLKNKTTSMSRILEMNFIYNPGNFQFLVWGLCFIRAPSAHTNAVRHILAELHTDLLPPRNSWAWFCEGN